MLLKMRSWLPALCSTRAILGEICSGSVEEDAFHGNLSQLMRRQEEVFASLCLATVSDIVAPFKQVVRDLSLTSDQLSFLGLVPECRSLMLWLLSHRDTAEFNRLLQVCRPCTDEPRLLSSIASLVRVRTLFLPLLYPKTPYSGLLQLLRVFQSEVLLDEEFDIVHMRNLQGTFDNLIEVFEKQTRSPGIKSCYDVRDISTHGVFKFLVHEDKNSMLELQILADDEKSDDTTHNINDRRVARRETLEYLLDLRSKVMMTEISAELEDELGISRLIEAFVTQLQVHSTHTHDTQTTHSHTHTHRRHATDDRRHTTHDTHTTRYTLHNTPHDIHTIHPHTHSLTHKP
jgi:hypothetical protein